MKFETTYEKDNPSLIRQLKEYEKYHQFAIEASQKYNIPWPVIAGIGSRESAWGLTLKPQGPDGTGDFGLREGSTSPDGLGWGKGLLQIDSHWHEFARGEDWRDPSKNILYGAYLVSKNILSLRKAAITRSDISTLSDVEILRAALAGYNAGIDTAKRTIRAERAIDSCTTGRNYSADVLSRAGWFQENFTA